MLYMDEREDNLSVKHVDKHQFRDKKRSIQSKYLLLGGVRELVFPSTIVALLYTRVRPQVLDCSHVRALERRHRFKVDAPHQFRFFLQGRGRKNV